jgi:hypothetical protein
MLEAVFPQPLNEGMLMTGFDHEIQVAVTSGLTAYESIDSPAAIKPGIHAEVGGPSEYFQDVRLTEGNGHHGVQDRRRPGPLDLGDLLPLGMVTVA